MPDTLTFAQQMRTMQIIAFALVTGCATFLGIVLFQRPGGGQAAPAGGELPLITIMAGGVAVACLGLRFAMPSIIIRNLTRSGSTGSRQGAGGDESLIAAYQTTMIVCMALIEGPTFMAIIAYMLEGHVAALALAIGLILILMLHFPTAGRVEGWIKRQKERMEMERGRAGE